MMPPVQLHRSQLSPPVVLLPLDPQLVDANSSLEDLQNIQHVDNVVEVQFQPVSTTNPLPGRHCGF